MKSQINQKLIIVTSIVLFAVFVGLSSCSKGIKRPDTGKPPVTGSSKIVYTDINPDSVILKNGLTDSFYLDLNNDGITDFEFDISRTVLCDDNFLGTWAYATVLSLKPANGINAILTNASNFPPALDRATTIAPDSSWATTSEVLMDGATSATGHCITSLPLILGYWINVSDKYIGFKFSKENNTYYGWARLSS